MLTNVNKPGSGGLRTAGFALVVTLSLMILLTVIAVGLLTLSAISLRSTSSGESMSIARANARLALMMALGELQKSAGPDQRVTAPANLVNQSSSSGIAGVWKSWKPDPSAVSSGQYTEKKTGDNFLGYLVSNTTPSATPDSGSVPGGSPTAKLVGSGTVGENSTGLEVNAPVVMTASSPGSKLRGGYAWAVLDEGVKARIDLLPAEKSSSLADQIVRLGAPARNRFGDVAGLDFLESDDEETLRSDLPKLVSMGEAEVKSATPAALRSHFHDYTVYSNSVQANVADGGLKTDLSVLFDGNYGENLPADFDSRYLYSNDTAPFPDATANSDVRWSLYANYARFYRLTGGNRGDALAGLRSMLPSGYRMRRISDRSTSPPVVRYEPFMGLIKEPVIMPTVIRMDMMFSLVVRPAHQGRATSTYPYMLHLMYLPVITLHNPYNTPLECNNLQVEFSDVPVGFQFLVNGQPANSDGKLVALNSLYQGGSKKKTFSVTLSSSLTSAAKVTMGPGETKIFGTPFSPSATWNTEVAANGAVMFDWANNKTGNVFLTPGLITGPNDAIGFDVDWLAPEPRASWATGRRNEGVLMVKATDLIQVRFGPVVPPTATDKTFTVTTKLNGMDSGYSQVFYKNDDILTESLSEGTSPRFPEERDFPETFPPSTASPLSASGLLEQNGTLFADYARAKPFALFSVGAKTTMESFTKSRPIADTGIVYQMAACDLRTSSSQGTSPMEIALVPMTNGSAAIESAGPNNDLAFFFGGNGSRYGSNSCSIYEVPLAPLQSIAQLRNANGASIGGPSLSTYTVGESRANPAIPAAATFIKRDTTTTLVDHSWLANNSLWDGYWFSTLSTLAGPAYTGSSSRSQSDLARAFFTGDDLLPNTRNIPYFPSGKPADPAGAAATAVADEGRNSAAYIMTSGGFNVNRTSVPAWTAALSGLAKIELPLVRGSSEQTVDIPIPRFRRPVIGKGDAAADAREKLWNSYRTLTQDEIETLAERIVNEVRERGPFLSMAEFVNRRISPPGELSRAGALQAALDKSGVNKAMESNARPVTPAEVKSYGWENPDAVIGNTGAGAPGEVSQGDLLSVLGSFIAVRSDTFRIRTYGDAKDAAGNVHGRAWCEAIVQRVPEHVDPADAPEAAVSSPSNVLFGRRFVIISFRWMSPKEI